MSFFLYFFLMSVFASLICQALLLYKNFVVVLGGLGNYSMRQQTTAFFALAWVVPAVVAILVFALDATNTTSHRVCWINMASPLRYAVIGPLLLMLACNGAVFMLVLKEIRARSDFAVTLRACLSFFVLLGLAWVLGLAVYFSGSLAALFVFNILVSSQGV